MNNAQPTMIVETKQLMLSGVMLLFGGLVIGVVGGWIVAFYSVEHTMRCWSF